MGKEYSIQDFFGEYVGKMPTNEGSPLTPIDFGEISFTFNEREMTSYLATEERILRTNYDFRNLYLVTGEELRRINSLLMFSRVMVFGIRGQKNLYFIFTKKPSATEVDLVILGGLWSKNVPAVLINRKRTFSCFRFKRDLQKEDKKLGRLKYFLNNKGFTTTPYGKK